MKRSSTKVQKRKADTDSAQAEPDAAAPPAKKTAPLPRSKRSCNAFSFKKLVSSLDCGRVHIPAIWKKVVDQDTLTVMLSQMDFRSGPIPRYLKYLRIQWENATPGCPAVPTLYVDQKETPPSIIGSILGRPVVRDVGDVVKLLNYLLACPLATASHQQQSAAVGDAGAVSHGVASVLTNVPNVALCAGNPTAASNMSRENIAYLIEGAAIDVEALNAMKLAKPQKKASAAGYPTKRIREKKLKAIEEAGGADYVTVDGLGDDETEEEDTRRAMDRPHVDLSGFYWSMAGPDRTSLVEGGGVHILTETLSQLQAEYPPGSKDINVYGWKLLHHMLGGNEAIREARRKAGVHCGMTRLLGMDVLKCVMDHSAEVFDANPFDIVSFKAYIAGRFTALVKRTEVKQNGALMAAMLYDPARVPTEIAGVDIITGFFRTSAPDRTCLSKEHSIYVNSFPLAELQRYFGPESSCGAGGIIDYSWKILQRMCGGEEKFNETIVTHRERLKLRGGVAEIIGADVIAALYAHATVLHSSHLRKLGSLYTFSYRHIKNRMDNVVKSYESGVGPTTWRLKGEPEPPEVTILERQKYWTTAGLDRTKLRPGHNVFIKTAVLQELKEAYGPSSAHPCIKQFSWALVKHMLGGMEVLKQLNNLKVFPYAVGSYLDDETQIAISLYADNVFYLQHSIHPRYLVKFCNCKIRTVRYRPKRNSNRRNKTVARKSGYKEQ